MPEGIVTMKPERKFLITIIAWHFLFHPMNVLHLKGKNGAWSDIRFGCCSQCYVMWSPSTPRIVLKSPSSRDANRMIRNLRWQHLMMTSSNIFRVTGHLCAGNSRATGEFPAQRSVTRRFEVFFDLRLNKRFSKQSWGWWFETHSRPLWRHCNVAVKYINGHPATMKHAYLLLILGSMGHQISYKWCQWLVGCYNVTRPASSRTGLAWHRSCVARWILLLWKKKYVISCQKLRSHFEMDLIVVRYQLTLP